ncbi:MAG: FtsX-like permease family protein [Chromatiales bacterium]
MKPSRIAAVAAFLRQSLRHVSRHPAQMLLALVGITLGVAVVVGIDLARASAQRSFELAIDDVVGKATHHIVGGPEGVDESLYARLRGRGIHPLAPIVEAQVTVTGQPGVLLRWLGVDPLAESSFREGTAARGESGSALLAALITEQGTALVSRAMAASLGLRIDDTLRVDRGGASHALRIVGWLADGDDPDSPRFRDLLVTDIATAQELLGVLGRLTRIDVIARDEAAAERIRRILPRDVELIGSARQGEALEQMARAFTTQLQALSLLAVLVGMFLIYNTMTFLVLQRREVLGTLRALGVTRSEVFLLIIVESLCLALAGTLLGILAGIVLGSGLTRLVARTISDHYYALTVRGLAVSPWLLLKAASVGLISTLVAGLAPATDAARVVPSMAMRREAAEATTGRVTRALTRAAVILLIAAMLVLAMPGSIRWGFLGLALLVLGCTALTPAVCTRILSSGAPPLARLFGWRGDLAARSIVRSLSRTAPAITALMLAVAATVGIGLMITSFRGAVDEWLAQLLRADLYVSATGAGQAAQPLPADLAGRIRALPEVKAISTARRLVLDLREGRQQLVVYALAPKSYAGFRFLSGGGAATWTAFESSDAVIVSEPYAIRHGLAVGNIVALRTDRGPHPFALAGIYRDYASDQGTIAISRRTYDRHFRDRAITGIGVYGRAEVTLPALTRSVQSVIGPLPHVSVSSRNMLRRSSLQIFDRTFTVTEVLRVIAGIIAFIGVAGSLIALQLERRYEHGVLRAIGVTPTELTTLIVGQAALMGLLAGLLAMPVGIGMAAALVYVINVRAFGWSMSLHVNPAVLAHGLLLATIAALLAGAYAALAASRRRPAQSLRQE